MFFVLRQADLFDISSATDIHGTKFDDPANPIAVGGVLDPSITPATYVSFVNYIDPTELARFGLHNGTIQSLSPSLWSINAVTLIHPPVIQAHLMIRLSFAVNGSHSPSLRVVTTSTQMISSCSPP